MKFTRLSMLLLSLIMLALAVPDAFAGKFGTGSLTRVGGSSMAPQYTIDCGSNGTIDGTCSGSLEYCLGYCHATCGSPCHT